MFLRVIIMPDQILSTLVGSFNVRIMTILLPRAVRPKYWSLSPSAYHIYSLRLCNNVILDGAGTNSVLLTFDRRIY